ncbi:acyP [Linum grandiflorum]
MPIPLAISVGTRFLLPRSSSKIPEPWRISVARLSFLTRLGSPSLHNRFLLSHPPIICSSSQSRLQRPSLLTSASMSSSASSNSKTVKVVIKGRVQGVFYRDWTVATATELGLKGWVRNRRDGTVEALFSGESAKVEEMEQRCRRGPPSAVVTGLDVVPCDDEVPGTGFARKPTV